MPSLFPTRAFRRTRERSSGLLFALGVDDLSSTLPTGQTLTLTRATGRTAVDSKGRVTTLTHSQWPWSSVYNSEAAVWEPTLDIQNKSSNIVLQSENFGTTWTAIGTPTRTAAAAYCGDVALDLIGDDAAGTLEGYSQSITITGSTVKGVSAFLKAGTSTSTVIRLRDTTASANRLLAVVTWASGVPTVTMTTGGDVGTLTLHNGSYRVRMQSSSCTAGNAHQIEIYPASTSALAVANTGTCYVGGVQVEDFGTPTSYIKTTTAVTGRNKDVVYSAIKFPPQDCTVYCRTVNYSGINAPMFSLGSLNTAASFCTVLRNSSNLRVAVYDATPTIRNVDVTMPSSSVIEFAAQFVDLTTGPRCRIDTGSGYSAYSATGTPFTAWGSNNLSIGTSTGTTDDTYALNSGIRRLLIAPGARTLAEMQGLNV